jgi:hypothetical protein
VNLNEATRMLRETGETLHTRMDSHQQLVQGSFTEAVQKLSDTSSEIFIRSDQELNRTFEKIAIGVDLMNKSLRELGENRIPDDAKKKRRFFGR